MLGGSLILMGGAASRAGAVDGGVPRVVISPGGVL
jgi:hypothetical protein